MIIINSTLLNQEESDLTIINPSLVYNGNYEPITSCLTATREIQQTQSENISNNVDDKQDFVYIDHNLFDTIKQVEIILNYYRQDLKQDTKTQLDCNRKLIRRLVDFIRPIYSSDEQQMKNLDDLHEDISILHEKKFLEIKEKNDQLRNKIRHLQKSIITTPVEDDDRDSLITNIYRMNNMFDYEECIEIEEETKRLQNLVQTQQDKINELIKMLSQDDQVPTTTQQPTTCSTSVYPKIPEPVSDIVTHETSNEEHHVIPAEKSPSLTRPLSYNSLKKCPVCNHEFHRTTGDFEIDTHIKNCTVSSDIIHRVPPESIQFRCCTQCHQRIANIDHSVPSRSSQYICSQCTQQIPNIDEDDLQQLTEYFNGQF